GDIVMEQQDKPLCKLCTCKMCKKHLDWSNKKEKQNSIYAAANAFPQEDLFDILDKYWLTLQVCSLYPDQLCEHFRWSVEINSPAYVQRCYYHLILWHLETKDELYPW